MARNYSRNTPAVDEEKMKKAISAVLDGKLSVRASAKKHGVGRMPLSRHCESADSEEKKIIPPGLTPVILTMNNLYDLQKKIQIFDVQQEAALVNYILQASNIYFGLSPKKKLYCY